MSDPSVWTPKPSPAPLPSASAPVDPATTAVAEPEGLFATYEQAKGHPFVADHYGIPGIWNNEPGGYSSEVSTIEGYFQSLVKDGELDNSTEAVKKRLKQIEHEAGVETTDRLANKLGRLAAYVRFLLDVKAQDATRRKYVP